MTVLVTQSLRVGVHAGAAESEQTGFLQKQPPLKGCREEQGPPNRVGSQAKAVFPLPILEKSPG